MAQENKFEYINEVIQELINECEKEGLALILQATDNEGFAASGIVGSLTSVGRNLIVQEQIIKEQLKMPIELIKILGAAESCNCDKCKKRNEKVSTDSYGNEN